MLDSLRQEFFDNVWDHSKDPFQLLFDTVEPLSPEVQAGLVAIHQALQGSTDDSEVAAVIKIMIDVLGEPMIAAILQLSGLTRNKIITDLKASSLVKESPSTYRTLHKSPSWSVSGPYLAASMRKVFEPLTQLNEGILESLNNATRPGFIRQERAKRQGHEAEYRLATVFSQLHIPFEPTGKATNPLCPDAIINDVSFDLVVPSSTSPLVVIKSTVHTANIGQYGESKDHLEITEARDMLVQHYPTQRPTLLAMIDGIGFRSNSAGLNGVLTTADEFCQFATIWKAVVIACHRLGWPCIVDAPDDHLKSCEAFVKRYAQSITLGSSPDGVACGKALVKCQNPLAHM